MHAVSFNKTTTTPLQESTVVDEEMTEPKDERLSLVGVLCTDIPQCFDTVSVVVVDRKDIRPVKHCATYAYPRKFCQRNNWERDDHRDRQLMIRFTQKAAVKT